MKAWPPNDFSWEMARRVYEGSGLPPLRNMADPELVGDPDHYFPVGSFDNLEVHSGSAIGNLWFTRLVDGFQGRTGLDSIAYDINNTSMDTLSQIVFHANRYYLLPFNKYSSFRSATERSVIELYGDDSYLLPLVTTAWESVGVPLLNEELPIDLVLSCDTQRSSCHTSDNAIDLRLTNNSKKEYEPDNDDFIHILGAKIDTLINITDTLSRSSSTNIRLPATYFETGYDTLSFEIVADDLLPHNNSCETPVFFDPDLHPYNLSINSIRVIEDCFMFSYNLVYNLKNEGCESIPSGEPIKVKLTDDQGNSRLVDHILSYNMTTGYSSQNIIQLENAELQSQSFELEILYDNDEDDSDNFARSIGRDTIWREGFQADFEVDNIFEYQFNSRPTVTTDTFSIQEYMGSKMLFFTSLGNPNSTNCPAYFGESSLNTCIDLTGVLSPKLSFDLALLRNDHAEYASLESSTITVLWRDMSLNQDQEVINGLPEAMINNLEIDMPSDFIGELIFFFHCRLGDGTLDGSILDKDGILLDNIKINAEPLQTYQEEKEKTVNIYPNPGSQSVLIDTRKLITEIKILDVNGRECLQNSGMDLTTIDISSLPNGYYLVKLTTIDKITYTSQFVKLE